MIGYGFGVAVLAVVLALVAMRRIPSKFYERAAELMPRPERISK
jgi:hypothetical protein